jgi:hypothetical protein
MIENKANGRILGLRERPTVIFTRPTQLGLLLQRPQNSMIAQCSTCWQAPLPLSHPPGCPGPGPLGSNTLRAHSHAAKQFCKSICLWEGSRCSACYPVDPHDLSKVADGFGGAHSTTAQTLRVDSGERPGKSITFPQHPPHIPERAHTQPGLHSASPPLPSVCTAAAHSHSHHGDHTALGAKHHSR